MLVAELLLLSWTQLAQGHAEDGVAWTGVSVYFRPLRAPPKDREPALARGRERASPPGTRSASSDPCLGLGLRRPDHPDDFVDIRVGQEQAFGRVCSAAGLGPAGTASGGGAPCTMAEEFLQNPLEERTSRLAVDKGQKISGRVLCG